MTDDDLDRYLDGDSELSELYRAGKAPEAPTPAADAAVLAAAKRAVNSAPTPLRRARRWWVPGSVAATLVLGTSLYLLQQPLPTSEPMLLDAYPVPQRAMQPAAEAELAVPEASPPSPALTAPVMKSRAVAPAAPMAQDADRQRDSISTESMLRPPLEQRRAKQSKRADETKKELQGFSAAPAPTEAAALAEQEILRDEAAAGAPAARRATVDQAKAASADLAARPQAWLADIEALLRSGKIAEATAALTAFQTRHPDYPLPPTLIALLESSRAQTPQGSGGTTTVPSANKTTE